MAERVFARKMEKVGFTEISIGEHRPFGIDEAAIFPLFTDEVIRLMRQLIPPERAHAVAISVIAKGRKPTYRNAVSSVGG